MGHSSQVRGKAACADRHCSQSKWPSARIVDIDIDTRCLIYSGMSDRLPLIRSNRNVLCFRVRVNTKGGAGYSRREVFV